MDTLKWYAPLEMRLKSLTPDRINPQGQAQERFETTYRKTVYGHHMLIGALMCRRPDAFERLNTLPFSTKRRIEREIHRLHLRRPGRPLIVIPLNDE